MNETSFSNSASTPAGGRVLVLAPDENLAAEVRSALSEAAPEAQVEVAHSLEDAQALVLQMRPDLFVLDIDANYDLGQEFLYDLRTSHPHARAIILTAVHFAADRAHAAGLGAIHFLEKPFPHDDFVALVGALLMPGGDKDEGEKFQGTLSDLHIADIVQLKCMSGATSVLEFTGPRGEKARIFFENGQVRHAIAPGKQSFEAFNEIVNWKGGMISEVADAGTGERTIDLDWQILLMEAVRKIDETRDAESSQPAAAPAVKRHILVIDDSVMLLNFVTEILSEANYSVASAATAEEGLRSATDETPDLILLDYVLPDMKGDEVLRRLSEQAITAQVPVVYMSGFGTDRPSDPEESSSVVGSLHKPFTSELLLQTVGNYLPATSSSASTAATADEPSSIISTPAFSSNAEDGIEQGWASVEEPGLTADRTSNFSAPAAMESNETSNLEASAGGTQAPWWEAPAAPEAWSSAPAELAATEEANPEVPFNDAPAQVYDAPASPYESPAPSYETPAVQDFAAEIPMDTSSAFFCGDTSFFSLNWALHTISAQKLTGTLRAFWNREPVELIANAGEIILATTRDPELYCPEAPITLVNLEESRTMQARQQQRETGRPLFVTLAQEGLILREPAMQLVQHYGQKLFSQLWTAPRVRFMFEQSDVVPAYARDIPSEGDVDHWALSTLRFVQFGELSNKADYDPASIPAYTRDGFERVQNLRLTVAEAQFASQFNGTRSIAQIAKNLRLDLKFARLTLFRFRALEIIDCWPPATVGAKPEKRGVFGRMFGD